jgi:asparagine synthase (glutamine-hydrolysing)
MCGFAGILNSSTPWHANAIRLIASAVAFRGPDHTGIKIYDEGMNVADRGIHAFFFNRLSIIDLDPRSNQPFEDDRHTLLFNGEIYNYQELKTLLNNEGVSFKTTSDTEVLFHSLRRWGKEALTKLNGMFAFAWIDRRDRTFLLARDRVGIKPLYYKQENDSLIFGSELDSIFRLSGKTAKINQDCVRHYLWLQYTPSPLTIIENIFKLPAGHYLEGSFALSENRTASSSQAYWNAYEQVQSQPRYEIDDIETLLVKSLKSQLHADVPVGLFLSSGVDSSLLAALINKHFSRNTTFNFITIGFDEPTSTDESYDAISFLDGFKNPNLVHHRLELSQKNISESLDTIYNYYDEPFGDPASLLNWAISAQARKEVKVAISGDGGDELFWGYPRYNTWKEYKQSSFRKFSLIQHIAGIVASMPVSARIRNKLLLRVLSNPIELHNLLFRPAGFSFIKGSIVDRNLWWAQGSEKIMDREDLTSILDIKTYLADAMLYKVDRSSMAASLEVRVPFLDNEVIDFALTLPLKEKMNSRYPSKAILKDLLCRLAPHYSIDRPKKGFGFPFKRWIDQPWKERILSTVTRDTLENLNLDSSMFLKILSSHYSGESNYSTEIWRIFNLALWHEKFQRIQTEWSSR